MSDLKEMMARHAQDGRVAWIGLRPRRREGLVAVERAEVALSGLKGDHGRKGKRAVTLVQGEHLPVVAALLGRGAIAPEDLRRNLVIEGLNLSALRGAEIELGGLRLRIEVPCHPCSRMEETFGPGGYSALRGHGGWCASVVEPGEIAVGDAVRVVSPG